MRWKIEVFHKVLKSGSRAEQARLRTAERLVRLLAVFCILSWRVFWLTMLNRVEPDLEPALVLTELETNILDHLIPNPTADLSPARTLSLYFIKIRQPGVLAALAAAQDTRAVFKVERLSRRAAVRAGKAVSPAGFLQVGGAGRIIGEKSLELG